MKQANVAILDHSAKATSSKLSPFLFQRGESMEVPEWARVGASQGAGLPPGPLSVGSEVDPKSGVGSHSLRGNRHH